MTMKAIVTGLIALSVLAAASMAAGAASTDCKLKGWKDGNGGGTPIFECPSQG
jgi:hypothetical protein